MYGRVVLAGLALAATGVLSVASAQDRWIKIGEREIDLSRGSDAIDLSGAKGAFKSFRVVLPSGNVVMSNIQVRYTDGKLHNERRPINLLQGERTKAISAGGEKFVEGMVFCFKEVPRGKATVEVQALQSRKGGAAKKPAVASGASWAAACPGASGPGGAAIAASPSASPAPSAAAARPATPAPATPATPAPTPSLGATPTAPVPVTAAPGTVLPGGAVLFGVHNVGFVRDRDVIRVGSNLGQFDRVQFRVLDNDVFINDLEVVYADGTTQKLAVNTEVKQNTRTRWLEITGTKFIKEIQMTYRSRPSFKGQARIEVYGQYAEGWLGPNGRGRQFNEGWVLLGAQTAGRFLRTEVDTIQVGRNEGNFKRIRVTVKDRALVFDELRIVYGNGEEEVIPVKTTVAANATYGPIDLKGGSRVIREIKARYRSAIVDAKAVGRGASVVEVWGQH